MQFHLNGYKSGDPGIAEAQGTRSDTLPTEVDVLIVGCGPAGLTLAAQLAAFPDITTCIVDQKPGPLQVGQADGIACRTMEMFQAFGFSDKVLREAYWVNETTFWKPDATNPAHIARTGRIQDTEDGLSEMPHVILNQARVHDFYLEVMRNSPSRLEPYYARRLADLMITPGADHAVTVTLDSVDEARQGLTETVRARYVVGCDGARSAVRKSIGRRLHGDSANHAWGVMDVLAVTDFPDVRLKTLIQSDREGSILIIPREGGYMARFYIEMDKLNADERVANRNITSDQLIAAANRILHPYTLEVKEIPWWSVYEIGQRLCDRFDDVPENEPNAPHVFIAGDACHTHSPKAGQGMNVSMQDSFNLGWKLAAVLQGRSAPDLLHSYSAERQSVAQELIDFDREWSRIISERPAEGDTADTAKFQSYFIQSGRYTAGTAIQYKASSICGTPTHQHLATGFQIGGRFHSAPVVRLSDAKPMHLGHTIKADGRWRIFAFAGTGGTGIDGLCDYLASPQSPVTRFTPKGADMDAVIDLRAIFQEGHRNMDLGAMHPALLPRKGKYGLIDYEKIYCPDLKNGPDLFDLRGIAREAGCMVVVRPDQHVAHVLPLDEYAALSRFFAGFMLDQ